MLIWLEDKTIASVFQTITFASQAVSCTLVLFQQHGKGDTGAGSSCSTAPSNTLAPWGGLGRARSPIASPSGCRLLPSYGKMRQLRLSPEQLCITKQNWVQLPVPAVRNYSFQMHNLQVHGPPEVEKWTQQKQLSLSVLRGIPLQLESTACFPVAASLSLGVTLVVLSSDIPTERS